MRYINPQLVGQNLPNGWSQQAQQAEDAVAAAEPGNRSAEVDKRSQVWQALKNTLKSASHDKCWYCESIDIRSDNAVDHFRPKNAVAECPEHEGYWWIAFKWENYRFCCTYCNSFRGNRAAGLGGGKDTHFPLRNEAQRARTPTDSLDAEEPMLLDPTISADPGILWFDVDGRAAPNPVCGGPDSYTHERARISICVYHLNHRAVVDQRKALCHEIRARVEQTDRYFKKYDAGDGTARGAFDDAILHLKGMLGENAPYSSTARAMLMGLRGTHPVVDVVLAG